MDENGISYFLFQIAVNDHVKEMCLLDAESFLSRSFINA